MGTALAEVVFSTWQAMVLILLSVASLLIALYCLLFMVPLKSFVQRVNSLGGGMRGIRVYVDEVAGKTDARIAELQGLLQREVARLRTELTEGLRRVSDGLEQARARAGELERRLEGLRSELAMQGAGAERLRTDLEGLRSRLGELGTDLEVLGSELNGSVRALVEESYQGLEGTVLGALEAVQDQMLLGTARLRGVHGPGSPPGRSTERPRSDTHGTRRSKIISAVPLFGEGQRERRQEGQSAVEEGAEQKAESPQHSPAK